MALQMYEQPGSSKALALLRPEDTEEARQKRLEDAEKLAEKLKVITDTVPHRIQNIMGSNAGAGSGEFHMYRQARRREQMRLERIEEQEKEDEQLREHQAKRDALQREEDGKTAKRRAKRQKKKEKQQSKRSRTEPEQQRQPDADASDSHGNAEQHRQQLPEIGLD